MRTDKMMASWDDWNTYKSFPFIHRFMTSLFLTEEEFKHAYNGQPTKNPQLKKLLKWMADYHRQLTKGTIGRGPKVLIVQGPAGSGKSFLSREIMRQLFGTMADASPYFTGQDEWTIDLVKSSLMIVDDDVEYVCPAMNKFWSRVCTYLSTDKMRSIGKYKPSNLVPVTNRLVISLAQFAPVKLYGNSDCPKFLHLNTGSARFDQFACHVDDNAVRVFWEIDAFAKWLGENGE